MNRIRPVSRIVHTILGVDVLCKIQIQPAAYLEYTDGEISYMYKDFKKTKSIGGFMEAWALHTKDPTVHWEDKNLYLCC